MPFEWDSVKAKMNFRKHGVSFDEAQTVFGDMFALTSDDLAHSESEDRERSVGRSERGRVLVVISVRRAGVIRIVSARPAVRQEVKEYEEEVRRKLVGER